MSPALSPGWYNIETYPITGSRVRPLLVDREGRKYTAHQIPAAGQPGILRQRSALRWLADRGVEAERSDDRILITDYDGEGCPTPPGWSDDGVGTRGEFLARVGGAA